MKDRHSPTQILLVNHLSGLHAFLRQQIVSTERWLGRKQIQSTGSARVYKKVNNERSIELWEAIRGQSGGECGTERDVNPD